MYIPPTGLYFRLLGKKSQRVLFSRTSPEPGLWHAEPNNDDDTQLFTIVHGTGARAGKYAFKGKETSKVLYSHSAKPVVGHADGDGANDDNWFTFNEGTGDRAGTFRLICPATKTVVYSRNTTAPQVGNIASSQVYGDQYFSFAFEEMAIRVEFHVAQGRIVESALEELHVYTFSNTGAGEGEGEDLHQFSFNKTATHTWAFGDATGFPIVPGTALTAALPYVVDEAIHVPLKQSTVEFGAEQHSYEKSYAGNFSVTVGANQVLTANTTVTRGTIEVPYTVTLTGKRSGVEVQTTGIWRAGSTWDLNTHIRVRDIPAEAAVVGEP